MDHFKVLGLINFVSLFFILMIVFYLFSGKRKKTTVYMMSFITLGLVIVLTFSTTYIHYFLFN